MHGPRDGRRTEFIWWRWMFLTGLNAPETRKKPLLLAQIQEWAPLFAVPWSGLWGDCSSSAADDAVQATSCPAAFITFINAFNSAECCSAGENAAPIPLRKNRQLICFSSHRYCRVQTHRLKRPRTATDNAAFVGAYSLTAHQASTWQRWKRIQPTLILQTCQMAGSYLRQCMS